MVRLPSWGVTDASPQDQHRAMHVDGVRILGVGFFARPAQLLSLTSHGLLQYVALSQPPLSYHTIPYMMILEVICNRARFFKEPCRYLGPPTCLIPLPPLPVPSTYLPSSPARLAAVVSPLSPCILTCFPSFLVQLGL